MTFGREGLWPRARTGRRRRGTWPPFLLVHPTGFRYTGDAGPSAPGGIAAVYRDLVADDVTAALERGRQSPDYRLTWRAGGPAREHQAEQEQERLTAGQLWQNEGWLFAAPAGGPTNPRTDDTEWKRLLARAGVRTVGCTAPATPPPLSYSC